MKKICIWLSLSLFFLCACGKNVLPKVRSSVLDEAGLPVVLVTQDMDVSKNQYDLDLWNALVVSQDTLGLVPGYISPGEDSRGAVRDALTQAVSGPYQFVWMNDGDWNHLFLDVVQKNPSLQFGLLGERNKHPEEYPNLVGVTYREEEAAFLAGFAAAHLSRTGQVGLLTAEEGLVSAFCNGVEYANQGAFVSYEIAEARHNEDKVRKKAEQLCRVADVLYSTETLFDSVVIETLKQTNCRMIGHGIYRKEPVIFGSMEHHHEVAISMIQRQYFQEKKVENLSLGIKEQGIIPCWSEGVDPYIQEQVAEIAQQIAEGSLQIPAIPRS